MSVTEIRYGAAKQAWGQLRSRALERDLASFTVVKPDDELIAECARLRATCASVGHALGQKVHEADRWVAVTAIRLGVPLVSDDSVFRDVPGLTVLSSR